jgi:hypothetical protein
MATSQQETALSNGGNIGQPLGKTAQDYPVEVQVVLTSLRGTRRGPRHPDNTTVIREMVEGTRRLISSFIVTRIDRMDTQRRIGQSKEGRNTGT